MSATDDRGEGTRTAVLGTGIMGSAMARNLLARAADDRMGPVPLGPAPLAEAGAEVAASRRGRGARCAGRHHHAADGDAVSAVIFDGRRGRGFAPGRGVGADGHDRRGGQSEIAARLGSLRPDVLFVDAPVSGSKGPAEPGQLLILASGPPAAQAIARPVFSAIGRKTVWLGGEAGQGSRMKLVVNAYMSILIEGVAEALELADQLGVDDAKLAEAIEGGPLDAPIADAKLHKMERGDYAPEFPMQWALKDVDLALARRRRHAPLLAALSRQWRAAVDAGLGREDVSVARLGLANTNRGGQA